jgi:hypothetical protein
MECISVHNVLPMSMASMAIRTTTCKLIVQKDRHPTTLSTNQPNTW